MKSWTSKMEMTSIFIEKMRFQELRFGVQYSDRDRQECNRGPGLEALGGCNHETAPQVRRSDVNRNSSSLDQVHLIFNKP